MSSAVGAIARCVYSGFPKTRREIHADACANALRWIEGTQFALCGKLVDHIVIEWVPMYGITYDSRDDLLDVVRDRMNHLIGKRTAGGSAERSADAAAVPA
jgi:hypothetical protein